MNKPDIIINRDNKSITCKSIAAKELINQWCYFTFIKCNVEYRQSDLPIDELVWKKIIAALVMDSNLNICIK
ncbi:MAG: hypothetical protein J6D03_00490 [Clostridia bacterium]|nr:hypothetical protein [Clostridia bacterium]